jgi:hypothetical protein
LVYGKHDESPPFMTRTEIDRIIERGGLNEDEIEQLCDAMYLTIPEVNDVLELVKTRARYLFIYPMFAYRLHRCAPDNHITARPLGSDFAFAQSREGFFKLVRRHRV